MTNKQSSCKKRRRGALYNPVKTVQALFNHEPSSDLTLQVNDTKFYCHRIVLVPICNYVQRFIDSHLVSSENDGALGHSNPVIKIDLPDVEIPESFQTENDCNIAAYFEKFLQLVYLHHLNHDNPAELFVIAQIADFIICELILKFCDDILSTISYNNDNVLDVALFCQKYPLPNTFQVVKKFIAQKIGYIRGDPKLNEIQQEHFFDIMKLPPQTRYQQFFAVYNYATGQVPVMTNSGYTNSGDQAIKDDDKRRLFQDVVLESSTKWCQQTLLAIITYFSKGDKSKLFGGSAEDRAFLSETFIDCYYRLYKPPNK